MRIAFVSCFYPYRGGIAQFSDSLLAELSRSGEQVRAFNFSRMYPSALFPGKTQYVDESLSKTGEDRMLDSIDPVSWRRTAGQISRWKPDVVLVSWWMSFFGPSLGSILRHLPKGCKRIALIHNLLPHEGHLWDKPLTRRFLGGCDGAVCLSDEVGRQLKAFFPALPSITLFHPIYSRFGDAVPRAEALEKLGLPDDGSFNLLFFGLIRHYKGLDILLEACRTLEGNFRLIVAGEPYSSFEPYQKLIDSLPCKDRIHLFLRYIPDSQVKDFFCASDLVVLPYRSATQSGIEAVALNFGVPSLVTDVGAIGKEVRSNGTGVVCERAESGELKAKIELFMSDEALSRRCREGIARVKSEMSWEVFVRKLKEFLWK